MKFVRLSLLLLLLSLTICGVASAAESAQIEAEKLLDSMNSKSVYDQSITLALESQLKANPNLVPYKDVMLAFFAKYTSYEALKPATAEIYASEFSASELKELREFYSTPTGRKAIEKIPALMAKGSEMGAKAVQDHIEELQQMIVTESKRIEDSEKTKDKSPQVHKDDDAAD